MGKRAELSGTAAIIFARAKEPMDAYFTGRVAYVRRVYTVVGAGMFTYYLHDVKGRWKGSVVDPHQLLAQTKVFRLARKEGFTQVFWVH